MPATVRTPGEGPPGPFEFSPEAGVRNALVWAGLSYTFGDQGFPIISTPQPFANVRAVNSTDARAPSVTPDLIPLVPNPDMESLMEGSANQLARNWAALQDWIVHDRAVGGSELTDQDTGSAPFNNQLGMIDDVVTLVAPDSVVYRALCTSGFGFIEEAINGEPWATFQTRLLAFLADYRAAIELRTGQTFSIPLLLHQTGWWVLGATPVAAGYALEQLALALANPDVILTGASHQYDIGGDNIHLTNDAYLAFAEHYGEVLFQVFERGIEWLPLHATSAEAVGSTVVLTYHVPAVEYGRFAGGAQLVLDVGAYPWRGPAADGTTHGYRYLEDVGPARTITGVSVSGNQVTLTLDGAAEVGASIGYADIGAQSPLNPHGNLRDAWDGISESGNPDHLFNWACVQRIEITGDAPLPVDPVTFEGAGAGVAQTGVSLPVAFPAGIVANDLLIAHVYVRDAAGTVAAPAGWSILHGPDLVGTGAGVAVHYVLVRRADGLESGTQAFATTGIDVRMGRMYLFRNVALAAFTEGGGATQDTTTTLAHAAVTTTGEDRLVVLLCAQADDNLMGSFTGETGGDATETTPEFSTSIGADGTLQLQTATMTAPGTLSGGLQVMLAIDPWSVRCFALVPVNG